MTAADLAEATLILRVPSRDGDDAALKTIREEMRCADVYRDAACDADRKDGTPYRGEMLECDGTDHIEACPLAMAKYAWTRAVDARRKL